MCVSASTVGIATPQHQKFLRRLERRVYISHWPIYAALELVVILFLTKKIMS